MAADDPLDPQVDEFAMAVGYALHEWSAVETATLRVFEALSGMPSLRRARAAFLAIRSFETKLDVCHALMAEVEEDEEAKLIWDKLYARVSKYHRKRHQLAHFSIVETAQWNRNKGASTGLTLQPFWPGGADGLSVKQIHERILKFKELTRALDWFFFRHAKIAERNGEPPPQEPELIRELRALVVEPR